MSTDDDQPLKGPTSAFARRPVVWGRPAATVFRAGPLPKGEPAPPLPKPSDAGRAKPTSSILSGSMIPRAAPAPAPAPTPPEPTGPASAAPAPDRPAPASVPTRPAADQPDLTVRPLPPAEPLPETTPAPEVEPPAPSADERATSAPGLAATTRRRSRSRAPLYVGLGVAVVGVLAVGGWMLTRSPTAPAEDAVAPASAPVDAAPAAVSAAPVTVSDSAAPTVSHTLDGAARETPSPGPRPAAVEPPPAVRTAPPAETAPQPAPTPLPAPVTAEPPPRIEIVPLAPAAPPPTTAEPAPSDPDAPIVTRPQPLD